MHNITIFGIGGIGGYLGAKIGSHLPQARLNFIARGRHLETITAKGLTYKHPDSPDVVVHPAAATSSAENLGVQDLIFLCVKSYDLEQACREIEPLIGERTLLIPILNGMDIPLRIRQHLDRGILLSGATYVSSYIEAPGVVRYQTGRELFVFGNSPGSPDFDPAPLTSFLEKAGINARWFDDPRPAIWRKFLFISPYSLLGAWSGKTMGALREDPVLDGTVKTMVREVYELGLAAGVALTEEDVQDAERFTNGLEYNTTTSFQRDFADPSRKNELDLYGAAVVRLGESLGVATPVTKRIWLELRDSPAGK